MNQDLVTLLNDELRGVRVLGIRKAEFGYLKVRLFVLVAGGMKRGPRWLEILCSNAVDYSIRPKNPNCIEGGPDIEFHENHLLLNDPGLKCIPGGDGFVFDPPLNLKVLILDQSYVIAERFEIIQPTPPGPV
jgi:hypothetical protein